MRNRTRSGRPDQVRTGGLRADFVVDQDCFFTNSLPQQENVHGAAVV